MTEAWLRGPVADVPDPLMPAAHALIDAGEELLAAAEGMTPAMLWARPGGVASVGFHLRHVVGSLDRLLTYARGEALTEAQLAALAAERAPGSPPGSADDLLEDVRAAIAEALEVLRRTPPESLGEERLVGRAGLPSTVRGLLFHAAEHTRRHAGQVIATAGMLRAGAAWPEVRVQEVRGSWEAPGGTPMELRLATTRDHAAVARMRTALWPDSEEQEVEPLLDAPPGGTTVVLVGTDPDGRAGGFVEVGLRSHAEGCATSPVAYVEGIWVDPEFRGRGLGRALVHLAARWARGLGCTELASDAAPENVGSQAFHREVGFQETDRTVCFRAEVETLLGGSDDADPPV